MRYYQATLEFTSAHLLKYAILNSPLCSLNILLDGISAMRNINYKIRNKTSIAGYLNTCPL